jgi:hypothetical protein
MNVDSPLGERLQDLASDLDLPDIDLGVAVMEQISDGPVARRGAHRWLLAGAAAVVVVLLVVLAVAPARHAVADWLGIGSTSIRYVPETELPEGAPPELGDGIPAGREPSPLPRLGEPDAAFRDDRGVTSYVWAASEDLPELGESGWGAILSVRQVTASPGDMKLLARNDEVQTVTVGQSTGLWIPGQHLVAVPGQAPATAYRVLLWVDGPTQYRLETQLPLEDAVALGGTVEGTSDG